MGNAALHTAVLGRDLVCSDYAVAGGVLHGGAVVALQHQEVKVGVGAEAVDGDLGLSTEQGDGGDCLALLRI